MIVRAALIHEPQRACVLLNIGAGKSVSIENHLTRTGVTFTEDRLDVFRHEVRHPSVRQYFVASIEDMKPVASDGYDLAFANYVLEHIKNLDGSAREIHRVLKPCGIFIASLPNPTAPEFRLAKYTPLTFHQWIRGHEEHEEAHETQYTYTDSTHLIQVFENAGLRCIDVQRFSFTEGYLYKFLVLSWISRAYDRVINRLGFSRWMGNVCLVFQK